MTILKEKRCDVCDKLTYCNNVDSGAGVIHVCELCISDTKSLDGFLNTLDGEKMKFWKYDLVKHAVEFSAILFVFMFILLIWVTVCKVYLIPFNALNIIIVIISSWLLTSFLCGVMDVE